MTLEEAKELYPNAVLVLNTPDGEVKIPLTDILDIERQPHFSAPSPISVIEKDETLWRMYIPNGN